MNDIRIGIDLGTCYSNVGYIDHHGMHFIQDPAAGQRTDSIPSSALLRADNSFIFGELAESEKSATPEGYQREFKRDLGKSAPYWLRDRKISAADLTAKFLEFLVDLGAQKFGAKPASAVITFPADFNQTRQSTLKDAARHAGLTAITLIAEPVAAVIGATEGGEVIRDTTVLVYDLGGGTFDAAVVRLDGSEQQVLGDKGLEDFGGTDIDVLIQQDFARKAGDEFAEILAGQNADDPKLLVRARRAQIEAQDFCRNIKHRLSSTDHVSAVLHLKFDYELSRRELEDMVRPHLDRTVSTCRELLASIALTPNQIDTVLLVGGGSYMPMVQQVLATELNRPVRRATHPELAVCMGAAILARTGPAQQAERQANEQASQASQEVARRQAEERARKAVQERTKLETEKLAARQAGDQAKQGQPAQLSTMYLGTIGAPQAVQAVAFSPDRTHLAFCWRKGLVITDLTGRQQLEIRPPWYVTPVDDFAYSPDGRRLVTLGSPSGPRIWDASTGDRLQKIKTDLAHFSGVAFSPDGTRIATACGLDKTARIWDASTSRELIKIRHDGYVRRVAFSPDGTRIATASDDKTARIWDASTGRELLKIHYWPKTNNVYDVAFSPDGTRLATGSRQTPARIWDASTGRELLKIIHTSGVLRVMFSPDGTLLATASGKSAIIWDARSARELFKVTHTDAVRAVAFSRDGTMFATASNDKTVQLWQLRK